MPIQHNLKLRTFSEDEFHAIDYEMMRLFFATHKDIGRLCDEGIYQVEIAHRGRQNGFDMIATEVPIRVSHGDFTKTYFVDVLVNNGALYELKAASAISPEHRKQTLSYLLLLGLYHAKIVNLRPSSVEHEFVSTRLTTEKRYQFSTDETTWQDLDADGAWLREFMKDLLRDWGAFLDVDLFYEAVQYFRGGPEQVIGTVQIVRDSRVIGTQHAHLLNPDTAFKLTAITQDLEYYTEHLRRFLQHTALRAVQWINFD